MKLGEESGDDTTPSSPVVVPELSPMTAPTLGSFSGPITGEERVTPDEHSQKSGVDQNTMKNTSDSFDTPTTSETSKTSETSVAPGTSDEYLRDVEDVTEKMVHDVISGAIDSVCSVDQSELDDYVVP